MPDFFPEKSPEQLRAQASHALSSVLHYGRPGRARREAILSLMKAAERGIHVNRRWCPQLGEDRDLAYLLKKGKLKRTRDGLRTCRHTVLVLANPNH
jgi:hypothetical protein